MCFLEILHTFGADSSLCPPRTFLAAHQVSGCADTTNQPEGEIRFPDWCAILEPLLMASEQLVQFNPMLIGGSELLHDARRMGKYDNDSNARRRGEYEVVTARSLWTRCTMAAITTEGSALHCAIQAFRSRVDACGENPHSAC